MITERDADLAALLLQLSNHCGHAAETAASTVFDGADTVCVVEVYKCDSPGGV